MRGIISAMLFFMHSFFTCLDFIIQFVVNLIITLCTKLQMDLEFLRMVRLSQKFCHSEEILLCWQKFEMCEERIPLQIAACFLFPSFSAPSIFLVSAIGVCLPACVCTVT